MSTWRTEIAREIEDVARRMWDVGNKMCLNGHVHGDKECAQHGGEMVGASLMAEHWAKEVRDV